MVDPGALVADALSLEVDIGPLLIMAYGPLVKVIPSLKVYIPLLLKVYCL